PAATSVQVSAQRQTVTTQGSDQAPSAPVTTTSSTTLSGSVATSMTAQLTETLHAANAPPAGNNTATGSSSGNSQSATVQSVSNSLPSSSSASAGSSSSFVPHLNANNANL